MNLYEYAGSDPINYVDPNGRWILAVVAGVGLLLGFGTTLESDNPPQGAEVGLVEAVLKNLSMLGPLFGLASALAPAASVVETTISSGASAVCRSGAWEDFLPQAERRVADAFEKYGGDDVVNIASKRFDPNQQAVIELAKRAQRTGVTQQEAETLMQWSQDYGLKFRNDIGTTHWVGGSHIHVGPVSHIPVH